MEVQALITRKEKVNLLAKGRELLNPALLHKNGNRKEKDYLITGMLPPISSSWPPLEAAIQKNTRYFKL